MAFTIPPQLEAEIDEIITHYPQRRSASMMVLHALQEHFGWLSKDVLDWTARKLELQPIHLYELVTFYPMFRQRPFGRHHLKVCRTLSCALSGSRELYAHLCRKLGLDAQADGPQHTPDGRFTVELVECLAGCGAAPVMMRNDDFYETVTREKADHLLAQCVEGCPQGA